MKKIILALLLFTTQAFGQVTSTSVDANITGGSLSITGTSAVSQSGVWTTGRTWSLLNTTDSVNSVQSGTWNVGLLTGSNTIGSVTQSGAWTTGRTWSLLNTTDSVNAVQSGTWNLNNISGTISLPTGASTSALQTSGNASLTSIDGKLTSFDLDNTAGTSQILGVSLRQLSNGTPVEVGSATNPMRIDPTGTTTQPARITDGTNNVLVTNNTPPANAYGLTTRTLPYGPATFTVSALGVATALNKNMISIENASGSTVDIKIKRIYITNVQTTAVTGVIGFFNYNKAVSHTGGTLLTPVAHDSADTLNGSVTVRTNATVNTLGATFNRNIYSTDEIGIGGLGSEEQQYIMSQLIPAYADNREEKSIRISPGEAFTIQFVTNTTTGLFDLTVVFTQEAP